MLEQFPEFSSVEGCKPVQLIEALATLGDIGVAFEGFARAILNGRLDPALRELVVLRVAWVRRCAYIWGGHMLIAADVNLRLPNGDRPFKPEQALAIAVTDQLLSGALTEVRRSHAVATWGAAGFLELATVVGDYLLLSTVIEARGLTPEPKTPAMPAVWPGDGPSAEAGDLTPEVSGAES